MFNVQYEVSEVSIFDMDNLQAKVAQLNMKAAKRGIKPIIYSVIGTEKYTVSGKHWYDQPYSVEMTTVKIEYPICKIDGWQLLGKIDHKENLVLSMPNREIPDQYRNSEPVCEHCKTNRDRNETFILTNGTTTKQVGRSCLGLFLGMDSETAIAMSDSAMFSSWLKAMEQDDEDLIDDFGFPKTKRYFYDLDVYLPFVAQQIRLHGWISKDKAQTSYLVPTADLAFDDMLDIKDESKKISEPTTEDRELAASAVQWASELTDFECGEYLRNLRQIAQNGHTSQKMIGYAASMIIAYTKVKAEKIASENPVSNHLGKVGEKITVKVTLSHVSAGIHSRYGTSYINTFITASGDVICWNTGKQIAKGQYTLTATVKSHDSYRNVPQTWVERAKLEA